MRNWMAVMMAVVAGFGAGSAGVWGQSGGGSIVPPGGGSIVPPGGGGGTVITGGASGGAGAGEEKVLAPILGNQSLAVNAMLGSVNGEPVFALDVFAPIDEDLRRLATNSKTLSEFRNEARGLIEKAMKAYVTEITLMTVAKAELSVEEKQRLDLILAVNRGKIVSDYGGSIAAADKALMQRGGSTLDQELVKAKRKAYGEFYLSKTLRPRIVVTRPMLLNEYYRDTTKWDVPATFELYMMALPIVRWLPRQPMENGEIGPAIRNPTPEQIKTASNDAVKTAKTIVEKLRAGGDFSQLAEDFESRDRGGTHRYPNSTKEGMANQRLAEYASKLPAKTIGEPLLLEEFDPTQTFVFVVMIGEKSDARTIPFEEAQLEIYERLQKEQWMQLYSGFIMSLAERSPVEAVPRMLDTAVQVAVTRYASKVTAR